MSPQVPDNRPDTTPDQPDESTPAFTQEIPQTSATPLNLDASSAVFPDDSTAPGTAATSTESTSAYTPYIATSGGTFPAQNQNGDSDKKRRTKKIILISLLSLGLALTAGGIALALWYTAPEKAVSDAVANLIASKTVVSDAHVIINNEEGAGKTKIDLKLSSKLNAASVNGQLDASIKYTGADNKTVNFSGAGLLSNSGNIYFKLSNVSSSIDTLLESDEAKEYVQTEPKLKTDLQAFAKKIENTWIKLEQADIKGLIKKYDHKAAKECYEKAYDDLWTNSKQKQQIYNAYDKHSFFSIKEQGSEAVNGVDSTRYTVGVDVGTYHDALNALNETDFTNAAQNCDENLWGKQDMAEKPSGEELREQQQSADKTKVQLWVSRFGHDLMRANFSYADNDSKSDATGTVNFKHDQDVNIGDPAKSLSIKELQSDLERISDEINGYKTSPADSEPAPAVVPAR